MAMLVLMSLSLTSATAINQTNTLEIQSNNTVSTSNVVIKNNCSDSVCFFSECSFIVIPSSCLVSIE